jgi:4-alpha-glucanotransferase
MPEILTPDEFDELAGEDQFNQEQNEAYRVLYEMHEAALERIEAMKKAAHEKNAAIRSLNDRLTEALDREAAFTAAMEDFLDDEIVDALDRPRPCLKVMGVVKSDGAIDLKGAI